MASGVVPALMQLVRMLRAGSGPSSTQAVWREAAFPGVGRRRAMIYEGGWHRSTERFASRRLYHPLFMQRDSYCHQWKSGWTKTQGLGWQREHVVLQCEMNAELKSWFRVELGWSWLLVGMRDAGSSAPLKPCKTKVATSETELGKLICLTPKIQLINHLSWS